MNRKTLILLLAFSCLLSYSQTILTAQKTQAITWQKFSNSGNIYGVTLNNSRPLQFNDELNTITFIQRASQTYSAVPAISNWQGVVVTMITSNWGTTWDSTCLWSNNIQGGRYPQGAICNPIGNSNLNNAHFVGTGPVVINNGFDGFWAASKQLGVSNYNSTASTITGGQQYFKETPPYPNFGLCFNAKNSFCSTDDGQVRTLAELSNHSVFNIQNDMQQRGAVVLTGTLNNGIIDWRGDSILCPAALKSNMNKNMDYEFQMAWNESGTVGYVVFIGSRIGEVNSNKGWQPIIFKTSNGGASWHLLPAIDFNAPSAANIRSHLTPVSASSSTSGLTIPLFTNTEGWALAVDKNNKLHVACFLTSAKYDKPDSVMYCNTFGTQKYRWKHTLGFQPYLYDFIADTTNTWAYGIVDSLTTEAPSTNPSEGGYSYNPWSGGVFTCNSRIQLSRSPNGKYIVYTWAETDTLTGGVKWNTKPNIKARLIDTDTYLISNTKLNLTQGTNALVSNIATFHFAAPTFSLVNTSSSIDLKLPLTVSNNQSWASLISCDHWFAAADLSFSSSMHSFTSSIATTGIKEQQITDYNLLVYPNPTKDYITIKCQEPQAKITITNLLGQTLYQNDNFDTSQNIDLSTLSKAVYFLKIEIGRGQKVIKILKD